MKDIARALRMSLVAVAFTCAASLCQPAGAACEPNIRAAVVNDAGSLHLRIRGGYEIFNMETGKSFFRGENLNVTITPYEGGIALGELKVPLRKVALVVDSPDGLMLNSRRFRSDLLLVKKANGTLLAVNRLPLEEYVKGVLYHEVSHYWPAEALKAQAIVCRTYALAQVREGSAHDFDVTSDTYSQVYGGRTSERYRTTRAVDQTKGMVLTWQGKVFPAYFHATCGGRTEDAAVMWNLSLPPLQGVVCGYCRESPHYFWHDVVPLAELGRALEDGGVKGAVHLKGLSVLSRDASGRVKEMLLTTQTKEIHILGKDFRNAAGPNLIRSTDFTIEVAGKEAVFKGKGWGHGVGMCQWGAYFLAKQGKTYSEILHCYYPGAEITDMEKAVPAR